MWERALGPRGSERHFRHAGRGQAGGRDGLRSRTWLKPSQCCLPTSYGQERNIPWPVTLNKGLCMLEEGEGNETACRAISGGALLRSQQERNLAPELRLQWPGWRHGDGDDRRDSHLGGGKVCRWERSTGPGQFCFWISPGLPDWSNFACRTFRMSWHLFPLLYRKRRADATSYPPSEERGPSVWIPRALSRGAMGRVHCCDCPDPHCNRNSGNVSHLKCLSLSFPTSQKRLDLLKNIYTYIHTYIRALRAWLNILFLYRVL